jgi:beta-galactosidase/beta-glucuronidase
MSNTPRPEYPRPDLARDEWLNLNGRWGFEMDPACTGIERGLPDAESLERDIVVPFCMESELSGVGHLDFVNGVWYRRDFSIPETWTGMRIMLRFEAVDYDTRVWVNGTEVGQHRGGYSPFGFDITDALHQSENTLTVFAQDDTRSQLQPSGKQSEHYASHGCHYTRTTGIWQTVWLEPVPAAHIERLHMTPIPESGILRMDVHTSSQAHGSDVSLVVSADGETVAEVTGLVVGDLAQMGTHIPDVRWWSPSDPFLYDITVTLSTPDGSRDTVSSYVGMRSLGIQGKALLLNGKPKFQRLVLDQGYYPDGICTAPSDEALKRDIEISMGLGFDGARLHMRVFERRFLYWADKLGYLVWGEYPNWGIDHSDPAALARVHEEWVVLLQRDINHPSIVGWCPFNETPPDQDADTLRAIYRTTKLADPTRPCIDTSGYVHTGQTDVYDSHNYEQNVEKFAADFQAAKSKGDVWRNLHDEAPYLDQSYFVSEYGGIWWNPGQDGDAAWGYGDRPKSEQEFIERYRGLTETLLQDPDMCAFCYTQLYDIEQEVNGLYTYDRKPKFDPAIFREINQQPAAIEKG